MKNKDIEVIVYRRPNMFRVNANLYNMIGVGELEKFFTVEDYKGDGDEIERYYPERFLNIAEQRSLLQRLEASNYKKVRIITSSVHLIQCSQNVKVAQVPGEGMNENNFNLSWDECGMPNDAK